MIVTVVAKKEDRDFKGIWYMHYDWLRSIFTKRIIFFKKRYFNSRLSVISILLLLLLWQLNSLPEIILLRFNEQSPKQELTSFGRKQNVGQSKKLILLISKPSMHSFWRISVPPFSMSKQCYPGHCSLHHHHQHFYVVFVKCDLSKVACCSKGYCESLHCMK